jgi:hypothetical protein
MCENKEGGQVGRFSKNDKKAKTKMDVWKIKFPK